MRIPPGIKKITNFRDLGLQTVPHEIEKRYIPFSSLAEESFIIYPRVVKPDYYDFFITLCHQAGFQPKIIQEATPPFMILSLVSAGVGISVLGLSDEAQQYTGVVFREIAQFEFYLNLGVISHKERSMAIVTEFLEVVKQFSKTKS